MMNFQPDLGASRRQAKTRFRKSGEVANGRRCWARQAPDRETRERPAKDLGNKGLRLSPPGREQHPPSLQHSFARLFSFTSISTFAPSPLNDDTAAAPDVATRAWLHNARPLPRTERAASANRDHDCRNTHANTRGDDTSRNTPNALPPANPVLSKTTTPTYNTTRIH